MTGQITGLEGWRLRAVIFSVMAATVGYLVFALWGGWQDVLRALVSIGTLGALIALAMSLVNYSLRFGRWQLYLGQLGHPVPWRPSLRIYLSGFALTTTPGKAGEVFRGVLLKQRGVPFPASFAAFLSERLSDLVAVVLLTLLGLAEYPQARQLVLVGVIGISIGLVCISSYRLLFALQAWSTRSQGRVRRSVGHLAGLLLEVRRCHRPGMLLVATLLSLLAWGAEALAFYWVLTWLGTDISLSFAMFVYALSMLAGAVSFLPGGLGGAEVVMVSLLVLKGMTTPAAVAATVFIRLATLWFAVAIGLAALYRSRHGEQVLS